MLFQGISETFLCYTMSMTQNTCLRGVNLGGWLVLEKWMTPAFFADSDAVDEHTFMQTEHAIEKLTHHRDTFITEADWQWLAEHGIDIVRIPVGYWLLRPDGAYLEGIKYLDWAFAMAKKYNILVLIDLHGAPGSQNGNDHSGKIGEAGWFDDDTAQAATIEILTELDERYRDSPQYWGLELMNEPRTRMIQRTLRKFYRQAAQRIDGARRIIFHDGFTPRLLSGALRHDPRSVMDVHLYHMASWVGGRMSAERFVAMCERWYGRLLRRISRRQPIIVGEWSVVLKGESLERYSGDEAWALMQKFGQAQLAVYEQHALAWFYWNYKTEGRGTWNFRSLVEDGFLELPPRK